MYSREITETSKSALLELGISLKTYRDDMVLSGGWAPYFITEKYFEHCGSVDIDLVLKTTIMPKYESIREIVMGLGYTEERPFRFSKEITSPIDGRYYPIHVDFLCDKCDLGYMFRAQPDLPAFMFEGLDIAFDSFVDTEIETVLPGNGVDRMSFKVLGLAGSIVLKGQALSGRRSQKDAYDIFALTHFMGGPDSAARQFNQDIAWKTAGRERKDFIKNSLFEIRRLFKDGSMRGSFDVESFSENRYRRDIVSAQVNRFLDPIDPIK